jgi:putative ABC transport system permease protein
MNRPHTPGLMGTLLRQFAWRHWLQAPKQSFLLVLVLALGIAVFFSIRLANRAALASFQTFTDLIVQECDWLIQAPAGLLPESVLQELRSRLGLAPIVLTPIFETTAVRAQSQEAASIGSQETLQLLGVDLIGIQNLAASRIQDRSWFGQTEPAGATQSGSTNFWRTLRDPRAIYISKALAERDRLRIGDPLPLVIHERVVTLTIAGLIPTHPHAPRAPAQLLIMDLPSLQALVDRRGMLSRIEFQVPEGDAAPQRRTALQAQLQEWSQDRWMVSSPGERRDSAATMTRAFRLNLTILSLIALMVGLYLIFQALDGAVVRRREEIGILRSLGVEEGQIQRVWLLEATMLGLAGGLLGGLLGWAGAQLSVRLVGRTVNALYYTTSVNQANMAIGEWLLAIGLAVGTSLLAGWIPARNAARTPPAQILVRHAKSPLGMAFWQREGQGAVFMLLGFALLPLPPVNFAGGVRFPLAGYFSALCWILGGGILGGAALRGLARLGRPLGARFISWRLSAGHLLPPSGRHRLATAGLVCAIAMTAGMGILVSSFDTTMRGWIERTFQADLYVSSTAAQSATTLSRISAESWKKIVAHPGVADANIVQSCEVSLPEGRTLLSGAELSVLRNRTQLPWVEEPLSEAVFRSHENEGLAVVSESFSERFRKRRGDRIPLPTPSGTRELTIAGVFADYGNERGSILIERQHFARWFQEEQASALMLFLKTGSSPEAMRSEWQQEFPGLRFFSNAHLRSEILRIFQQTFAITYALEIIGVLVAVVGLGLTLVSLLLERRGELGILRSIGMTRQQIARATACEGLALAAGGVVAGTAVSLALGWMLIHVINKQTFGWTLVMDVPWLQISGLAAFILAVGTAVSFAVGRWGATLPSDREE